VSARLAVPLSRSSSPNTLYALAASQISAVEASGVAIIDAGRAGNADGNCAEEKGWWTQNPARSLVAIAGRTLPASAPNLPRRAVDGFPF
jgi:hypothetical protein